MDFTDEDEDYVFQMLGERIQSSPSALQRDRTTEMSHSSHSSSQTDDGNDANSQHSDMVNVFNSKSVYGASTDQTFGVPVKRCSTSSENYELQEIGIPKRKCVQKMEIEQNVRRVESTAHHANAELGKVVNDLFKRESTRDQWLECMANKITTMELEMKTLKADNAKLSEELKSVTEQNKIHSERIDQLEVNGICVVCCTDKINIWVNPCQHWVMCSTCYKMLSATLDEDTGNRLKKCPVCRENINFAIPYYGL
ncbi:unnamed protein product [Meganyctiphanes norvegica]|uniref:RING-type domain-containing protein n=1 Tax=Meganyctiphanes norvegica TaxID=48144 RepID=A0AAV2QEV3_MEGNR